MRIKMYGTSDVGRVRKVNQDNYYCNAQQGIVIVADGIGGRKGGEVASALAVSGISHDYLKCESLKHAEVPPFLLASIDKANQKIIDEGAANEATSGMGTTLNALLIVGDRVYIAHIGDSRTYLYYKGNLWQLTLDHNMEVYIERGWLPEESLLKTTKPNALVRALGLSPKCEIDIYQKALKPGEALLTCSDGLTSMVSDRRILKVMRENENNMETLPQKLVDEANNAGGRDNITIVITEVAKG